MWIIQLFFVMISVFIGFELIDGLEKDIEVTCLDGQATTITAGGVVANCAFQGLTRTTTIAPWLFELAHVLQVVNASHNHFKKVSVFPVLPRLLSLTLKHNSIKEIEPLAFSGLENLQNLDLSYNRISGDSLKGVLVGKKAAGEENYDPLPVRVLTLSHNNISTLEPSTMAHLQFLRDLHLDNNPIISISDDFSKALQQLPEILLLNLANTGLKTLSRDTFLNLRLTSLFLNGNQFKQVPDLSVIGNTLQTLNINQNPIEELNKTSFTGLNSLSEVVISGMPELTKIREMTFSNLKNIKVISCAYNTKLVEIDENAFWDHQIKKHSTLQEVYLNNNALPRIKKHLLPWVKMTKVTLDGNKWVCDCRLHWLASYLSGRNNIVERLTELRCWEPTWLNGTQLIFWKIDTSSRHENFPCLAEIEEEKRKEQLLLEQTKNSTPSPSLENEEANIKMYYLIAIIGLIALVVLIVSLILFNKYKSYRPIYNVEKMSSPLQNEMKYMKGSIAEKTQLVP